MRAVTAVTAVTAVAAVLATACASSAPPSSEVADPATAASGSPGTPEVTTPDEAAPRSASRVETVRFDAPSLGVTKDYVVYLPAGYDDADRRFPVVYMLHGLAGNERNWSRAFGLPEAADELGLEAIVVMPDGDDSFYVNWVSEVDYASCLESTRPFGSEGDMERYCVKEARYRDYLVGDLVAHVDATYRTIPEREARAIGGLSMGGYGALVTAMKNRDVYGAVASHAGVAALTYEGPHPYVRGEEVFSEEVDLSGSGAFGPLFRAIFGEEIERWRSLDPAFLARELDDGDLAIYLDCGTEDEFRLDAGAAYLHDLLTERGVAHEYHSIEGGHHDLAFWKDRVDDSLRFFAAYFAR